MTDALLVDHVTRWRRTGRLALVFLRCGVTGLLPRRPSRRTGVRAAAGVLTALGARIQVHAPVVAWPRPSTGRIVVANRVGRLDDLALLTVVPDLVVRPEDPTDEVGIGRFDPARFRAAVGTSAAVCPVAVRYRSENGTDLTALFAGEDDLATAIRRALAVRGLVIEVCLLPALPPNDAEPQGLATLAENAIAARLSAQPNGHPSRTVVQ